MSNEYQQYKGQILGLNDTDETVQLRADTLTKSLKSINTDHSHVHNKQVFSISGIFDSIADSTSKNVAFLTPSVASGKVIHLKRVDLKSTNAKVRTDFYEAVNAQTLGTDMTAYNHYRVGQVVDTTMQVIKSNVTLNLTDATMLEWCRITHDVVPSDFEWVLKPNTWYVILFSNQSGSPVDISLKALWIEE